MQSDYLYLEFWRNISVAHRNPVSSKGRQPFQKHIREILMKGRLQTRAEKSVDQSAAVLRRKITAEFELRNGDIGRYG